VGLFTLGAAILFGLALLLAALALALALSFSMLASIFIALLGIFPALLGIFPALLGIFSALLAILCGFLAIFAVFPIILYMLPAIFYMFPVVFYRLMVIFPALLGCMGCMGCCIPVARGIVTIGIAAFYPDIASACYWAPVAFYIAGAHPVAIDPAIARAGIGRNPVAGNPGIVLPVAGYPMPARAMGRNPGRGPGVVDHGHSWGGVGDGDSRFGRIQHPKEQCGSCKHVYLLPPQTRAWKDVFSISWETVVRWVTRFYE
jgi:hypothetical protein